MDAKIFAAVAALCLLAFAGIAFAAPGLFGGFAGFGGMAGLQERGSLHKEVAWAHGALQNSTMNWTRAGRNASFNSTQMQQFQDALQAGDYAAAKKLNDEYGMGGPVFAKLNETTFAQYSQIYKLQSQVFSLSQQLRSELGIGKASGNGARISADAGKMGIRQGGKMRPRRHAAN